MVPLRPLLLLLGMRGPSLSLCKEAWCRRNLHVRALTLCFDGGIPLSFLTCQMGTLSSSQLEDSNAWKGPWHVADLSVGCCWSLQMRKLRLREVSEQSPMVTARC